LVLQILAVLVAQELHQALQVLLSLAAGVEVVLARVQEVLEVLAAAVLVELVLLQEIRVASIRVVVEVDETAVQVAAVAQALSSSSTPTQ